MPRVIKFIGKTPWYLSNQVLVFLKGVVAFNGQNLVVFDKFRIEKRLICKSFSILIENHLTHTTRCKQGEKRKKNDFQKGVNLSLQVGSSILILYSGSMTNWIFPLVLVSWYPYTLWLRFCPLEYHGQL